MARAYRADRGFGFSGEVELAIRMPTLDDQVVHWTIVIHGTDAVAERRRARAPETAVAMTARDFAGFLTRRLNGVQAWLDGRLQAKGDPILAARLVEMFGGESALVALD